MRSISSFNSSWAAAVSAAVFSLCSLAGSAAAADIEACRGKAQLCVACHGPGGNSAMPEIQALAGMPAQSIATALYQFHEGNRKNPTMSPFAANLSNGDMNNLAAYFASEKRAPAGHQTKPENVEAGPRLAKQFNCTQCHCPAPLGVQQIPRLAGQQHDYLLAQLRGFKVATRLDMDGNTASAASALKDEDIVRIADYIAGLGQ